jgi:hypothetical protein
LTKWKKQTNKQTNKQTTKKKKNKEDLAAQCTEAQCTEVTFVVNVWFWGL